VKPRRRGKPNFWRDLKLLGDGWASGYSTVDAWLRHLSRKSRSEPSRERYLRTLHSFCRETSFGPDELVSLPQREIERMIQEYADSFNNGKYSLRYANSILCALKSFFKVNGFRGPKELNLESYYTPTRYRKAAEYIPSKHEIHAMADCARSLRDRAIILTLFSTGLRNSTLRAVLYRDVKAELLAGASNLKIPVYPEMKAVDPAACKGNIPYYVFTCDDATHAIRLYLRERAERYGGISDRDPLFASGYNQLPSEKRRAKPLTPRQLQNVVKLSAKLAGLPEWRHVTPHALRKSFESVLRSELVGGGRLDPKVQEFFMGHILSGSQDNYFDRTKIEDLRAEYSRLQFGRVVVENKFKLLRAAVMKAFEGTGLNPEEVMEEYLEMKRRWKLAQPEPH